MDKKRDPINPADPTQELQREMEKTRQAMSQTAAEIKDEVSQAFQWQTYIRKYPGSFLIGGAIVGFMMGRSFTGSDSSQYAAPARLENYDGDHQERPVRFPSDYSSVRRVFDVATSALLAQLLPIVSSKVRDFFEAGEERVRDSAQKPSWRH